MRFGMSHFGRAGPPDIRDTYSLLVLNITFRTTADDLYPLFDRYGKVVDIFIPRDRRTGESRGFAFVRYKHVDEAQKAIDRLDGKNLNGRNIMVQFAKYDKNSEITYCGRITNIRSRSRSRSPKRSGRNREDYGRDREYSDNYGKSRRYERGRDRDGYRDVYDRDRRYERERSRDRYERDYSHHRQHHRERSRDTYEGGRSKDRYERERFNTHGRSRSRSLSTDRYSPQDSRREARRRDSSPAPRSPDRGRSPSPVRERGSTSPGPATIDGGEGRRRDASPVDRRSLSPEEKRGASAGPGVIRSPYNNDHEES